jgi:hypothetical protein
MCCFFNCELTFCRSARSVYNAFQKKDVLVHFRFPLVKGDCRAKHDLLHFKQVPGFYACHLCTIRGEQLATGPVVYYPKHQADQAPLRDSEQVFYLNVKISRFGGLIFCI